MVMNHVPVNELPYCGPVKKWLIDRYGKDADRIWEGTVQNYNTYLKDLPDYGGKKNGHARAIYGGLLIFALYPSLPDEPPISEIHGQLIRCGTCGNSDKCDYLIVGSKNKMAAEFETITDEQGFLVSRRVEQKNLF